MPSTERLSSPDASLWRPEALGRGRHLEGHPRLGASWEGFVVEAVARIVGDRNLYFWGTRAGAELDLLVTIGGKHFGIEIKYADAPSVSRSMRVACTDLELERLWIVHPGQGTYALAGGIEALGLVELQEALRKATFMRNR